MLFKASRRATVFDTHGSFCSCLEWGGFATAAPETRPGSPGNLLAVRSLVRPAFFYVFKNTECHPPPPTGENGALLSHTQCVPPMQTEQRGEKM